LEEWLNESAGSPFYHIHFLLNIPTDIVSSSFNPLGDIFFFLSSPWAASKFVCQSEGGKKEEGKDLAEEANEASDRSAAGKEAAGEEQDSANDGDVEDCGPLLVACRILEVVSAEPTVK
jgi:hypothetical protein